MAKKCCHCSSFFSCFTCFSRNTHPESATNLPDASANTVPIACPESQSSSSANVAVNSNVSPAAATEEADQRRDDPVRTSSASALPDASANTVPIACPESQSSSSANVAVNSNVSAAAATEEADQRRDDPVRTSSTSAPPFQTSTSQEASSSSATTYMEVSDPIGNIHKAAQGDNGNVNLEALIQHISELLELIKKNELDKRRRTDNHWPKSSDFLKLKEVLSEGTEAASSLKDIISAAQILLKGIGQAHWALAGLLVVSNVLERFEAVPVNRNECLSLLKEMFDLAKYVKQLKELPRLRDGMDGLIQEALNMIAKASVMCCAQIKSSKISRFFSATGHKKELVESQQELEKLYKRMKNQFDICLYDHAINFRELRPPTPLEREYPTYAVGIEEPIQKVVELLEWESQKNAVAVIVYGFGGVGKSTLADAVFARLDIVGCKYSMVRLFKDITSTPNIVELQERILSDLMVGIAEENKPKSDFRRFEDGQREIGRRLEKEVAFLYVDNVLDADRLQELLPSDMHMAKKVRVLITAQDMGAQDMAVGTVCAMCRMEPKHYPMKVLPTSEARSLLERRLNGQIESSQMNLILEICSGIPQLLKVVAGFINSEEDKKKAFRILKEDKDHLQGQAIANIERYVFAYDHLPERYQDPFLDICVFFRGLEWDFVADVVGESELNNLEKRALVSKDSDMHLKVHDVILKIGTIKAQETRFNFTDANESLFQEFLEKGISGIQGLWFGRRRYGNRFEMPATKLDSMFNSLRILQFENLKVIEGECKNRFEKLMFFQGQVAGLPFSISQMTSNLKYMELNGRGSSDVFEISPSDLQRLRNLRVLRLINFKNLRKLPAELGEIIHGLRELTISECKSIEEIPSSISKLQDLRVLNMVGCNRLRRLPEDIGSLSSLQNLDLSLCNIEELPESTSKLRSLKVLRMMHCKNLKLSLKSFESLDSLRVLSLVGCEGLQIDPKMVEKFRKIIVPPLSPPKRGQIKKAIMLSLYPSGA